MGCGKSSVGRKLSELLCCRFVDLDEMIEGHECRTIREIFAAEGEAGFRTIEAEALGMIINEYASSTEENLVLALGGGTVMTPECADLVHEHTYCIYLKASVDTLEGNLRNEAAGRPLLQSSTDLRTRITALMAARSSVYESVAHQIIDTDGKTIDKIASDCTSVCK